MVYNFFRNIPYYLQSHCLLCRCTLAPITERPSAIFGLCTFCHTRLPHLIHSCKVCGIGTTAQKTLCDECINHHSSFNSTICALSYEENVPNLIRVLKHQHDNAMIHLLADLLCHRITQHSPIIIDYLIATPMHWRKNLQRGNNHAHLLAKRVSQQLALPLNKNILFRHAHTQEQKMLTLAQRQHNLDHAFFCTVAVKDKHIVLIDDVITTGSTMEAMAYTLKQAGAAEVHCWAIARTPKHH